MILKWKDYLSDKTILLGSTSIQRKKLLEDLDLNILVMDSEFPEDLEKGNPIQYVQNTCKCKFNGVINRLNDENLKTKLLLGNNVDKIFTVVADTICVKDDVIIEKVNSENEAYDLIKSYSKNEIEVITSHIISYLVKENDKYSVKYSKSFDISTKVLFYELDEETIKAYIKTGEWINRAGAIAIQLNGKLLVKEINGCYSNIVGLSLPNFSYYLDEMLSIITSIS